MKDRIGFSRVKFTHPFNLKGVKGTQLPGTYSIERRDDRTGWIKSLQTESVSTWITIRHFHGINGTLQDFRISPHDLAKALQEDKHPRTAKKDTGEGVLTLRRDRKPCHQLAETLSAK